MPRQVLSLRQVRGKDQPRRVYTVRYGLKLEVFSCCCVGIHEPQNAARHAQAPVVDVYAECADGAVEVFVRDRGCGFDVAAVPADRFGLAESVVGRVERAGGEARVRSAPGDGTEIRLQVPRA